MVAFPQAWEVLQIANHAFFISENEIKSVRRLTFPNSGGLTNMLKEKKVMHDIN